MNGLTLRISGTNSKKMKGSLAYDPVFISQNFISKLGNENDLYKQFNQCDSVDKQLAVLRDNVTAYDEPTLRFLVLIFLQAETKHPVKCFLVRFITKNSDLQHAFSKALTEEILSHISSKYIDVNVNMDFVPKLASCLENFPAGALAVKQVEINLGHYLMQCLKNCVETLSSMESLSPTEKNKIFNLAHLTLRLLLYIIQKVNSENSTDLISIFSKIRYNIKGLLFDEDVPMDTKSISGLLLIAMYTLENGPRSWIEIIQQNKEKFEFSEVLEYEAGRLSLYSAVVTAVPASELSTTLVGGESALLALTCKILAIGEETSSDSTFTLSVTRTLVQISKLLYKTIDRSLGLKLAHTLLTFVWCHLEHYMDSVRHLTAQMLSNIVRYCTELKKKGDDQALNNLFATLTSLDKSRKSYYVSLTALTSELGASCILERVPNAISELMEALTIQAVQASATISLETLLQRHSKEGSTKAVNESWVKPIISYVTTKNLDSSVLNILEHLLLQAVKWDERVIDYLLPYMKQLQEANGDLKCVLMLLRVARKCSTAATQPQGGGQWKGLVNYELLKTAAVDEVDETRTLSLSLIVESPKSTESFTSQELELVLWYLKYNVNIEAPNFRQLTLSMMKKFIKRLEDSYKVLKRQNVPNGECDSSHYYLVFMESLRTLCYGCLIPEVNYSRRHVALQLLVWCEHAHFDGYKRSWSGQYVENLLAHIDDSYETNKAFALDVLGVCPVDLLKSQKQVAGLEVQDVLLQASSVKPTDCVTAAYKLRLLTARLPESIIEASNCGADMAVAEPVRCAALRLLLRTLRAQLSECVRSVVFAARHAPMYGVLHCMLHQLEHVDSSAISMDDSWSALVEEIVVTCVDVNAAVACIVNNSSPEGHLPMDMSGVVVTDYGNSGNVRLEDGRPVTAQMVLLCAWRSVKEVSLVLGSISSRLSIAGEESQGGTLKQQQLVLVGEHFTKLLAETKHRGAFEQAYVGFTKLLARLWRCRSPALHELPRNWLRELMLSIANDDGTGVFSATRRSAGLPFMIQALVTTELEVSEKPKCFEECVRALLQVCSSGAAHARAHSRNMLRALVRCAALRQHVAPYVGRALLLALDGFDGTTWEERNSSTLLLSALVVRVFGVARTRDAERLPVRNRMTGRVFFLRYPPLYDYMLEKLKEINNSDESQLLKPSLYPVLLLLARLYPSALEGTVSNLKLSCFVGPVIGCARSAVLKTRQLAARALVPLVPPAMYLPHIERTLTLLCDRSIKRNFCHGLLLQTIKLLENKPDNLLVEKEAATRLQALLARSMWILERSAVSLFCYLLADEYIKMLNVMVWKFSTLMDKVSIDQVIGHLDRLLDAHAQATEQPGGGLCLANAASLYFVLFTKYRSAAHVRDLLYKTLANTTYEVVLSALNYLLILNHELDIEDKLQEHLVSLSKSANTTYIIKNDPRYTLALYKVLKTAKYVECKQKCLRLLSLEDNTYKYIIQDEDAADEVIMSKLCHLVESVHTNDVHIYLYSLAKFVESKLNTQCVDGKLILETIRVLYASTSSDNSYRSREVVASFLEKSLKQLIDLDLNDVNVEERFEAQATLWASLVTILEDDDETLRRVGARIVATLGPAFEQADAVPNPAVGARAAELLRAHVSARCTDGAFLCVLGLLDFGGQVLLDDGDDECRVFEQSERYNMFAEGGAWAAECARTLCALHGRDVCVRIHGVLHAHRYARALSTLCGENAPALVALMDGCKHTTGTKADVFMRELSR